MSTELHLSADGKRVAVSYALSDGSVLTRSHAYRNSRLAVQRAAEFQHALATTGAGAAARLREARELNRALIEISHLPWEPDLTDEIVGQETLRPNEVKMLEAVLASGAVLPWRQRVRSWLVD